MRTLADSIKERILVLDGAMGTMIQQYRLTENDYRGSRFQSLPSMQLGNNDLLVLTRPDIIEDIHRKYLSAGADIIETCSFNAQRISMADYGVESYCREINLKAAGLARRLADEFTSENPNKPRYVAGSVGPTNKSSSISPDVNDPALRLVSFDDLVVAYSEQIAALIEGGVDAILIETIFDTLNAKAAIFAAEKVMEKCRKVPIMLSVTIADKMGRTLSGQTLRAFMTSVWRPSIFSIGLNCSFGAAQMRPFLEDLAKFSPCYISVYPNAGMPNSMGEYDQTAEEMASEMQYFLDDHIVNIIGGCCGTTDAYIRKFTELLSSKMHNDYVPYVPVPLPDYLTLSGLDELYVNTKNTFINVGERCNVAGSRKFLRLIREKKYDEAVLIARKQVEDGALVLDINLDDGLFDVVAEMEHFLHLIGSDPDVAKVPFMIDSSDWKVIMAALKCVQGKCIVNSISLKEGEEVFLQHAREVRQMGAAVVVMAFDEKGQADTYERKIEICARAYSLLIDKVGFNPVDIIFDPNVLAICTGMSEHDRYALDFIRATHWIREHLHGVHISGGVSNLSFSFRGNNYIREALHAVFLYYAIQNGMDMGIINPSASVTYEDIPVELRNLIEDVIFNRRSCADEMVAAAQAFHVTNENESDRVDLRQSYSVEERLKFALVKGQTEHLEADLNEAMGKYAKTVELIEGPLMDGMKQVGELFGEGKMFLPQVVKTARTMKMAVDILKPYLEKERSGNKKSGKILLATVKGDVHDIGKNIVSVILSCNNYEIIDLGVMCPAEEIINVAIAEKVDIIGLSGLITPSLEEMVHTAVACEKAGLQIPLILGGATTSKMHTALRIAPVYSGPVVWIKDASQMVPVVAKLLNPKSRDSFIAQISSDYDILRHDYNIGTHEEIAKLDDARSGKLKLF